MSWFAKAFSREVEPGSRQENAPTTNVLSSEADTGSLPENMSAQTEAFLSGAGSGSHDENALTQKLGAGPRFIETRICFRGGHC